MYESTSHNAVQGDGSREFSWRGQKASLSWTLPIRLTTQLVDRRIRRQDLDKSHPINPRTPGKSQNVAGRNLLN